MRVRISRLRLLWIRNCDENFVFITIARDANRNDLMRAYCKLEDVEVSIKC